MSPKSIISFVILLGASQVALGAVVPSSDHFNGRPHDFIAQGNGAGWGVINTPIADIFDKDLSVPSRMVIEAADVPGLNAWFSNEQGAGAVKRVLGDFRATLRVRVTNKLDPELPLTSTFNAAGFLILDPDSYSPGSQSWLAYNVGFQATNVARELKTTEPNLDGGPSLSALYLNEYDGATPTIEVDLRVCRMGDDFEFYWRESGAFDWNQEVRTISTEVMGNGVDVLPPATDDGTAMVFHRPDLSELLYVGLLLNAWEEDAPKQTRAEFEGVSFSSINPGESCI